MRELKLPQSPANSTTANPRPPQPTPARLVSRKLRGADCRRLTPALQKVLTQRNRGASMFGVSRPPGAAAGVFLARARVLRSGVIPARIVPR
jgi:hypothetical protein